MFTANYCVPVCCAALLLASGSAVAANYTYTMIPPPPGYTDSVATGIDSAGDVVGYYYNPNASPSYSYGFEYSNGALQTIPPAEPPTRHFTTITVSSNGIVLGASNSLHSSPRLAEYKLGNAHEALLARLPAYNTFNFAGVDKAGEAVGYIGLSNTSTVHGLVVTKNSYSLFDPPSSVETLVSSVSDSGVIGGSYTVDGKHFLGFIYQNGVYTTVQLPKSSSTRVAQVDDNGDYAGTAYIGKSGSGSIISFSNTAGNVETYQYPGYNDTLILRSVGPHDNFGTATNNGTDNIYYHYSQGSYYLLSLPGDKSSFISAVAGDGTFTGTAYDSTTNTTTAFVATCSAGPNQCTQ